MLALVAASSRLLLACASSRVPLACASFACRPPPAARRPADAGWLSIVSLCCGDSTSSQCWDIVVTTLVGVVWWVAS